jgi:hypothetical protein
MLSLFSQEGIVSFRHVLIYPDTHIYFFGERHDARVTGDRSAFIGYIETLLLSGVPTDVFTELEYIHRSCRWRPRLGGLESADRLMARFYLRFQAYLGIDKPDPNHRFHYCDIRSPATRIFSLEYMNIILDMWFEHTVVRAPHHDIDPCVVLDDIRTLLENRDLLWALSRIDKQVQKWACVEDRDRVFAWAHHRMDSFQLEENDYVSLESFLADNRTDDDNLSVAHDKIRGVCNLLVDMYAMGRILSPACPSRLKVVYMGEDHAREVSHAMRDLLGFSLAEYDTRGTTRSA